MESFLTHPNLPQRVVTRCILSGEYPEFALALESLGVSVIQTTADLRFSPGISYHADMLTMHLGGRRFLCVDVETSWAQKLREIGGETQQIFLPQPARYPQDVRLNAALIGEKLICNTKYIATELDLAHDEKQMIHIKQGYAKCSICIVAPNAVITSDSGIERTLRKTGFDVLLIQPGHILLKGFSYGFIGGCSGLIAADALAFCGQIQNHPDYERIRPFALNYGVQLVALSNLPLTDVGAILPITQIEESN